MEQFQSILCRERRKTLAITISRDGSVTIKAPLAMPISEISKFVSEKRDWIEKKLSTINGVLTQNSDVISYKRFLFFGTRYTPYWANVSDFVFDSDGRLLVPKTLSETEVLKKLKAFYRAEAKRILTQRVKIVAMSIGKDPHLIKFSDAKSRWGSCSSTEVVTLNWRLVLVPTKLVDYVIVHELAHLLHMNHSDRFWRCVGTYVPDFGILRKDLRGYAFLLNMFR